MKASLVGRWARAAVVCAAVGFGLSAHAALTAKSYITDGLIVQLDGKENVGYGQPYDSAATKWTDLTGNGSSVTLAGGAAFSSDCYGLGVQRKDCYMTFPNTTKLFAAYKAASYTFEFAYDKTVKTTVNAEGYANLRCVFLMCGHNNYKFGTWADNNIGACPNGADSPNFYGKTKSVTTTVGQHTYSVTQDGLAGNLYFDDLAASAYTVSALTESPSTVHGAHFNYDYHGTSGLDGYYHSVRLYDRPLTADEIAVNRAVDKVRYFGVDAATLTLPTGWRFDTTDGVRLIRQANFSVSPAGAGQIKVEDGEPTDSGTYWGEHNGTMIVHFTAVPAEGYAFAGWRADGLTDDQKLEPTLAAAVSGDIVAIFRKTDGSDVRDFTWGGTATDSWDNPKLWHDADGLPGVPAAFDNVTIPSKTAATLTNATPVYGSVTVGGTLVMRDWTAKLAAADITVANGGVIKPEGPFGNEEMSNRVWIVCGNLTVAAGGKINADLCGYKGKNGPGGGTSDYQAGAHGGKAGVGPGVPYGSLEEPETAGSGGGTAARSGGGIVRIDASGAVRMDGTVTANGSANVIWNGGGGAGGSVWINCRTIDGTGSVFANGGDRDGAHQSGWYHGGGGGGRISVRYDAVAQTAKDAFCTVRFEARGGDSGYDSTAGRRTTGYSNVCGGLGSLYFTDNRFLTSAAYRAAGWKFCGVWHSGEELPDSFEFADDFRLENCWLDFGKEGIDFDFKGNLLVTGKIARISRLMLTDADVTVRGDLTIGAGGGLSIDRGSLTVGGELRMDGAPATALRYGSELDVTAGPTNAPNAYGFELKVGGDLKLGKYASLFVDCCSSNGAIAKITAANVELATNAVINAQEAGWGLSLGYGKGSGSGYTGAAYGGFGGTHTKGKNRRIYGKRRSPFDPGSSSANMRGGGVIYLTTPGKLALFGTVNASSSQQWTNWYAGGSGGSVYLSCRKLLPSTGTVTADGGAGGGVSSAGGGGRIAIYAYEGSTNGMTITSSKGVMRATSSYGDYDDATDGTVYWKQRAGLRVFVR